MPKSFTERRKLLKDANYLDLRPTKSYDHKDLEEGTVGVLVPKFGNWFTKTFFLPFSKADVVVIKLDKFGSETWKLIDGKRDVGEICKILLDIFGDDIQPVEERITRFLTTLYEQRLISFVEIN